MVGGGYGLVCGSESVVTEVDRVVCCRCCSRLSSCNCSCNLCLQDVLHVEMGMVGQTGGQPCGEHENMRQMSIQKRTLSFQC